MKIGDVKDKIISLKTLTTITFNLTLKVQSSSVDVELYVYELTIIMTIWLLPPF